MKLRPYHNPENLDESVVPAGWRILYQDEVTNTGLILILPIGLREECPKRGQIWGRWIQYPWKHRNRTMIRKVNA